MSSKPEAVGQPWVKKIFNDAFNTGKPHWEVLQQFRNADGKLEIKTLKSFDDPHDGDQHAMNWMRSNTNLWVERR